MDHDPDPIAPSDQIPVRRHVVRGMGNYIRRMSGPGAVALANKEINDDRRQYRDIPNHGRTSDGQFRHLMTIPIDIYYYWDMKYPGIWAKDKRFQDSFLPIFGVQPKGTPKFHAVGIDI